MAHPKITPMLNQGTKDVVPRADPVTNVAVGIDYPHAEAHAQSAYFAVYSALANDTDVIEVRIQTPNSTKWAHMVIGVQAALAATIDFHEGTSMTHGWY